MGGCKEKKTSNYDLLVHQVKPQYLLTADSDVSGSTSRPRDVQATTQVTADTAGSIQDFQCFSLNFSTLM